MPMILIIIRLNNRAVSFGFPLLIKEAERVNIIVKEDKTKYLLWLTWHRERDACAINKKKSCSLTRLWFKNVSISKTVSFFPYFIKKNI